MKSTLFILLILASLESFAQDLILTWRDEVIEAIVQEVGLTDVKYKKANNPSGPVYTIPKLELISIKYATGVTETFDFQKELAKLDSDSTSTNKDMKPKVDLDLNTQGKMDAGLYYRKYRTVGTFTAIGTSLFPLLGLIPAVSCTSRTPRNLNRIIPTRELAVQEEYFKGFEHQSKKIKQRKIWTNFGIGCGVFLSGQLLYNIFYY